MTFETEFPSLKKLWFNKKEICQKVPLEDIEGFAVNTTDVQTFCLDKERVKQAIEKLRKLMDFNEAYNEMALAEYLKIKVNGKEPADFLLEELGI